MICRIWIDLQGYISKGGEGQVETQFRLRRADKSWGWVLSKGKAIEWDERGHPSRIIGLDINIQTVKETQEKMEKSETRFRTLFEMAPVPRSIFSRDGFLVSMIGFTG
jgi:PAS domain-containing protein